MWNINLTPRYKHSRWFIYPSLILILGIIGQLPAYSLDKFNFGRFSESNGFDLSDSLIPNDEILPGGPPRDGIPSLDKPVYLSASEMRQLKEYDRVLGLVYKGKVRAYPIRILNYHELVNDDVGGERILISFCPLCGTGMAFHARVGGAELEFGVSGLLYNSDVLMYDRQTHSLWSQIRAQAVSGEYKGTRLAQIPLEHTTWGSWKQRFPNSEVLSFDTGHKRNYEKTPYVGYEESSQIYFPVSHQDKRYHPKELVIGIATDNSIKAYPFSELAQVKSPLIDTVGGNKMKIHFNASARSAFVTDLNDKPINSLTAFWFAWYTFHPKTEVFNAK